MHKVFIIAEAGVNHNGSLAVAKGLIDAAVEAQADAVKFQTFKADRLISKLAPKTEYQKKTTDKKESQLAMIKKLELDNGIHKKLISYCKKRGIVFLSTPFDIESIDILNKYDIGIFKIPSGEITNLPYLRHIGKSGKPIIISTGMATLGEIETALNVLEKAGTPVERITVLHCNTEYPTPMEDVNLRAMLAIRDAFGVKVGYSDHTLGIEVPIAAVALGATVIEKHFTLDKNMEGPDHKSSLDPDELKAMIKAIRNIEKAFGDGVKRPSESELKNRHIVRKSIFSSKNIRVGDLLTEKNITTKRPGTGISPIEWDRVVGSKAIRNFKEDELIEV